MTVESSMPIDSRSPEVRIEAEEFLPRARFVTVSESGPVREIIDVAMVGLIGGGPRLAMRAAKVLLEDSYASRASLRRGRLGSRRYERRG
jgi:hypothetical protein